MYTFNQRISTYLFILAPEVNISNDTEICIFSLFFKYTDTNSFKYYMEYLNFKYPTRKTARSKYLKRISLKGSGNFVSDSEIKFWI